MQRVARLGIGLKSFIAPGELKGVAITKVNQNNTYYNINKICSTYIMRKMNVENSCRLSFVHLKTHHSRNMQSMVIL